MKTLTSLFIIALCLSSSLAFSGRAAAEDVSGKWTVLADANGNTITIAMELKQTGETFTGSTNSDLGAGTIDGGKLTGKALTATLHAEIQGSVVDFKMDGTLDGDKITGSFANGQFGSVPFTATRAK